MAEFCKVCGVPLKASNTVDYRPGSCRDCELERKKLYSGMSLDFGSRKSSKKSSKKAGKKKKRVSSKSLSKTAKKSLLKKVKLKKLKLLKAKKIKAKKIAQIKQLRKLRQEREKKKRKLREKIERLRKLRTQKALKLKIQRRKEKERQRKEREKIKLRIKKAKERERKLLKKEKERLRKEKEKIRTLIRAEKDRVRAEKRADKDRIRAEKQRLRLEKQQEKERLKKAKEAAKQALVQAREAARQAAHEQRRQREEAKKPPIVSVVTKVKDMQLPPDTKLISASEQKHVAGKVPQPIKVLDPKKLNIAGGASSSLLQSATTIPAKAGITEEKELIKQSSTAQHSEEIQKEVEKLQKDTDPIIDRYNPYSQPNIDPNVPRPPSPTPWLAPNFSVVKGDFKETKQDESGGTSAGLSDNQVKEIIEKIKSEHKKKAGP